MQKTFPMREGLLEAAVGSSEISRLMEAVSPDMEEVARRLGCDLSTLYRWKSGRSKPRSVTVTALRLLAANGRPANLRPARFSFIDLFSGIGGMRMGVEAAGGRCIFSCEWDRYARKTYLENFPDGADHPFPEDICDVEPDDIPPHDLLVAGFPCQPFSIAGVSKKNSLGRPHGFDDLEQGNLFFRIRDILRAHNPPAFLLENVKNLKSHDKGTTFATIMGILRDELGYKVQTRIIDAAGFVPQHRERIFIIGFREDTGFDFSALRIPESGKGGTLGAILHSEDGRETEEPPFTVGDRAEVAARYFLTKHLWTYLRNYAAKHRAMGNGFGYGLAGKEDVARTLSARYYKDGSEILIDRGKGKTPRRLTPRECARLMGFDRPNRKPFSIPVSDTRAYKQFGNAVVVPVVEAVVKAMVPHLLKVRRGQQLELSLPELEMVANG
jgi:DNA (cytosine-5)-methyltransferase 1